MADGRQVQASCCARRGQEQCGVIVPKTLQCLQSKLYESFWSESQGNKVALWYEQIPRPHVVMVNRNGSNYSQQTRTGKPQI